MIRLYRCPNCFVIKGYTEEQMNVFDQLVCASALFKAHFDGPEICLGIMEQVKEHPFFSGTNLFSL